MTQQMFSTAHWCCVVSVLTVCTSALFCDITPELPKMDQKAGSINNVSYLALEVNKTCFLFVMREKTMVEAARFCRSWGARLTSVDGFVDNTLQISIKKEMKMSFIVQHNYWVGLIWNNYIRSWLWENGDDLTAKVPVSSPTWWDVFKQPACVRMSSKHFESQYCNDENRFICKLTLDDDGDQVNSEKNETCGRRCRSYLTSHNRTYVVPTVQPFLDNSTFPSEDFDNTTSTVPTTSNDTRKDSQRSEEEGNRSSTQSMVVYLLAGLVLVLLLAVVGLLVEVCRTRRRLRMSQTSNKISLVDILMVDDTGYSQPDGRLPEADSKQSVNSNPRDSLLGQDESPENLYTSTDDTLPEAALLGRRLEDRTLPFNNYAHLHQGEDTHAQNIYGMESASSQVPRSPTYESYT